MALAVAQWLYCWELGGGSGHARRIHSVAAELSDRGHDVTLCVPAAEVEQTRRWWPAVIAAPASMQIRVKSPASFADLLVNQGWSDRRQLTAAFAQWQEIFARYSSVGVLLDFAPNALLAARLLGRPTTQLGTGFYFPPDTSLLPAFRTDASVYPDRLRLNEELIMAQLAALFSAQAIPAPNRLAEVFHHPNVNLALCTEPSLDHYPERVSGKYFGVVSALADPACVAPNWTATSARRVFAYLKPFPRLADLLLALAEHCDECLVWGQASVARVLAQIDRPQLRWAQGPADEAALAASGCELLVNHAGHDGSAKAMRCGLALLQIPLHIEQRQTAVNVQRIGAGAWLAADAAPNFASAIAHCLQQATVMRAAGAVYAESTSPPNRALSALVDSLESP